MRTDSNGEIQFSIRIPASASQNVALSASTAVGMYVQESHPVISVDQSANLSSNILVSGDITSDYGAINQNQVNIKGGAGQSYTLTAGNDYFINKAPVYFSRFANVYTDDSGQFNSRYTAARSVERPEEGLFSVLLDGESSNWELPPNEAYLVDQPIFAFWLKQIKPGQILKTSDDKLRLASTSLGINLTVETHSGPITLSQNEPLNDQWHQISFGVDQQGWFLSIDDVKVQNPISDSTMDWATIGSGVDDQWLILGEGFTGNISGLRIYDYQSLPLVTLAQTTGTFDSDGNAAVNVTANNIKSLYATTVAISVSNGTTVTANILPFAQYQSYYKAASRVYGNGSDLSELITLSEVFPAKDQPMESLYRTVTADSSLGPLESVLVAAQWMGLREETKNLEPVVRDLQDYLSTHNNKQVVYALADELARSLTLAKQGSPMRLVSMSTGMTIWAEVLDYSPYAADVIADAMYTKADLWTWLRYMSLPANGWEGPFIPMPKPENTCDEVLPKVNAGTYLAYSDIPCRATGQMIADIIEGWVADDPQVDADKQELTRQIQLMTVGLKGAPLEMTKLVFTLPEELTAYNDQMLPTAEAWNPAVLAARLMVFALKTGAKAGFSSVPSNLINFFQGNTNSRFDPVIILGSIAYLESRREGGPFACTAGDSCKLINAPIFKQIDKNIIRWFNGLSLAKDGDIIETDKKQLMCMLSNQAHGAALELVATAAYHALYEQGHNVPGFTDYTKYQIIAHDQYVKVPLRQEGFIDGSVSNWDDWDYGLQPDLIMQGNGEKERYWAEFKSWKKKTWKNDGKKSHFNKDGTLSKRYFQNWVVSKNKPNQFAHAQKQHFLSFIAARGELEDVWVDDDFKDNNGNKIDNQTNLDLRASEYRTWVQVWKADKAARKYQPFVYNRSKEKWETKDPVLITQVSEFISPCGLHLQRKRIQLQTLHKKCRNFFIYRRH
ncbi:MAG: LamG domain-containing protein, partial [Reinekea sp.]